MVIVVMGVSGSGKTTIGEKLAASLHVRFLDGDPLHSPSNIGKLTKGVPLTDADRRPWLFAIRREIADAFSRGEDLVVACSALKQSYREILSDRVPITWVYLKGTRQLIQARIRNRAGHFMSPDLLGSQYEALEEPADAITVDAALPPDTIVRDIIGALGASARKGTRHMQVGMVGAGRMGGNMVRRLQRGGHACVVFDTNASSVSALTREGAQGAASIEQLVERLAPPRAVWLMLPAALVDGTIDTLVDRLDGGDIIVDGGNSHYVDDIRRAARLGARGIQYVDVGVSGGVWGVERGYCLMIGGAEEAVSRLEPLFVTLAPGSGAVLSTPGRTPGATTADQGYLHCGPAGAGHFVKMVHNGIEYGLMAAYAEGFNLLAHAGIGRAAHEMDAETTPLRNPEHYAYAFPIADIAELWRRGSVVGSWLLDLTAAALASDPELEDFSGRVSDSGEGRWAAHAAIESATPMPVLTAALFQRFASRSEDDFGRRLLSAMRHQFGGHAERKPST